MSNLRLARNYIAFGSVSIVNSADEDYTPSPTSAEMVAGETTVDASAANGEVVCDETAQFVTEQTADEAYLKLPIPAFVMRWWAWFDERMGVTYR